MSKKDKIKAYIILHMSILLFSFTSVFTKMASNAFNKHGVFSWKLLFFVALMFGNCFIYAIVWQKLFSAVTATSSFTTMTTSTVR